MYTSGSKPPSDGIFSGIASLSIVLATIGALVWSCSEEKERDREASAKCGTGESFLVLKGGDRVCAVVKNWDPLR